MRYIELTRGQQVIVDDDIYDYLNRWKWFSCKRTTKRGIQWYAHRQYRDQTITNRRGKPKQILVSMHRAIMNAPESKHVDHVNGNSLDNRRKNLRFCNPTQNLQNQRRLPNAENPYKGVTRAHGAWRAFITYNKQTIYLGRFGNPKSAAKTYDKLAQILFGEFACLNFPGEMVN